MNKRAKLLILVLGFGFVLTGLYNNCSQTRLEQVPKPPEKVSVDSKLTATACSQVAGGSKNPLYMLFLVDMSQSNVGWPGSPAATDPTAERIKRLRDFITSCDPRGQNKYSIIPFSDEVMLNDAANSRCTQFIGASAAMTDLNNLQNINVAAAQDFGSVAHAMMKWTYYQSALSCMQDLMVTEIDNLQATSPQSVFNTFFYGFFVTDGAPTDNRGNPIAANPTTVGNFTTPVADIAMLAKETTGGFLFQSVYYGADSDFATAQLFLNPISQAGGTSGTKRVGNLGAGSLDFCKMTQSPLTMPYSVSPNTAAVVNLNAMMWNGRLIADSDADGIPDDADSNPLSRRRPTNNNVLDSICLYDRPGLCPSLDLGDCNPLVFNSFGLSECDRAALTLTDSGDADFDFMPDLIEILRHTSVNSPDSYSDAGDGIWEIDKLRQGLQLGVLVPSIDPIYKMKAVFKNSTGSTACAAGSQQLNLEVSNNPLVHTKAYHSTGTEEDIFGHADDENILFVYYYSVPSNPDLLDTEIRVVKPEVIKNKLHFKYGVSMTVTLTPEDFIVGGHFRGGQ